MSLSLILTTGAAYAMTITYISLLLFVYASLMYSIGRCVHRLSVAN